MEKQQRLIDPNVLMKNIWKIPQLRGITYGRMKRAVEETPSIDAEPVRHACWKDLLGCGYTVCSACDFIAYSIKDKYCPNCGAKMDGGAEEK